MNPISRRGFMRAGTFTLLGAAAACSKGIDLSNVRSLDTVIGTTPPTTQMFVAGTELLSGRPERFAFALANPRTNERIVDGAVQVSFAPDRRSALSGPFPAVYHGDGLGEKGVFQAAMTFPKDGIYLAAAEVTRNGSRIVSSLGEFQVGRTSQMPIVGERAPSVASPTFKDNLGVRPICTLLPKACSMHDISLDKALANGKPTVVTLATPKFCESRLCGPEVEILDDVRPEFSGINFVHIEVYKDDKPTTIERALLAPAATAWKLATEPATYYIAPDGMIIDRMLGPVDRANIRDALRALAS